ncbi:MAG: hypothetical protein EBT79_11515 [Actinobacteria bacterium]|nr:hypothetical protein [Actinomycetota bacterium]
MALNNVLLARLCQIGVVAETTRGTYAGPTYTNATTNDYKFLAQNITVTLNQTRYDRDPQWQSLTKYKGIVGKQPVTVSFSVECRRTGTTTTADAWFTLLQGCGWKDVGSGAIEYKPTSLYADMKCLSMEIIIGGRGIGASGLAVKVKGCMGNVTFTGSVGSVLMANFTFQGVLEAVADATMQNVTHESGVPPIFQGIAYSFQGSTTDMALTTFSFDTGNVLAERESVNASTGCLHYVITDRRPTGTIDPDLGLEADNANDLHDLFVNNTEIAQTFDLTNVAVFTFPKTHITALTHGNRNGILTANLTFEVIHTTTDSEASILFD